MMTRSTLFALALALAACYAHDANAAVSIPELRAEIASNSVDRSVRCRYYTAWYRDLCTEAEREAILERNVAAHRKWIEIAGKDDTARIRAELGRVLAIGGRWDEAEKELSAAIKGNISVRNLAIARWALAECLWRRGATDGAKKIVAEIAAMEFGDPKPFAWRKAKFMHRAWTDPDGDIDAFKLPHSVDGKPFPTPQEAKYGETKVSLAKVEIDFRTNETGGSSFAKATEDKREDPIIRLLKRKLARFGSKFEKGGTKINIEISPDAPVDKPQGYSLEVKRKKKEGRSGYGVVSIKARDRLGATYGVVSLLQCVERRDGKDGRDGKDEGRPRVRECAIRDWPLCLKRGVGAYWDGDHLEYSLFAKMRFVSMRLGGREYWDILFSPMERERCRLTVSRYQDFGLYCNWSERWLVVDPMLPLSSPRVRAMHLDWMRYAASIGANICFVMDDDRFPLPPADVAAAGTAANLDAKYLTGLFHEVKTEYPGFWMIFCPPFYWGPDGAVNYPEPRVAYLKSIAENLDSEIAVTWTGPRVKTCSITPKKFKWFADLVGRRPISLSHNGDCVGRHRYNSFGVDVPNFKNVHCPELFDLVTTFSINSSRYCEACRVYPAMDWSWNPEAHDAETATRRMMDMLEGPGVFDVLSEAMPALSHFDKYIGGYRKEEKLLDDDLADLERRIGIAEAAWTNALNLSHNGGVFFHDFKARGIKWAKNVAEAKRKSLGGDQESFKGKENGK